MEIVDSIRRSQPHLGTFVEIRSGGRDRFATERAIDAAFHAIAKVHRLMSFHDPNSDVSHLNREAYARNVAVDTWTYQVLRTAIDVGQHSAGLFDITIAPTLQGLGHLPYHEKNGDYRRSGAPAERSIELLSGNRVRFRHSETKIDLGGIAKGFAVDCALDVLCKHDRSHGLVNAGGDLAIFGIHPQTIHIRDPRRPQRSICQVVIENAALASSACSFELSQGVDLAGGLIIDPATQKPARDIAGVTVRASSCMIADALTKYVMVAGQRVSLKEYEANALIMLSSGEVFMTSEWQDAISAAA